MHNSNRPTHPTSKDYGSFYNNYTKPKPAPPRTTLPNGPHPSRPPSNTSKSTPPIIGMPNLGNTCYLNSILLMLSNMSAFHKITSTPTIEGIVTARKKMLAHQIYHKNSTPFQVTIYVQKIIGALGAGNSSALKENINGVRQYLNTPEYANNSQHDAQEFLKKLLFAIHGEINLVSVPTSFHENRSQIFLKD